MCTPSECDTATAIMIVLGSAALVVVMARIEARSGARDREIRAAVGV
jgi:hypothetical protein